MNLVPPQWHHDDRDGLSAPVRIILSILVTGAISAVIEFIGTHVIGTCYFPHDIVFWIIVAALALFLGTYLAVFRKIALWVPFVVIGIAMAVVNVINSEKGNCWWTWADDWFGIPWQALATINEALLDFAVVYVSVRVQKALVRNFHGPTGAEWKAVENLFTSSTDSLDDIRRGLTHGFPYWALRLMSIGFFIYGAYVVTMMTLSAEKMPLMYMFMYNPFATVMTFGKLTVLTTIALTAAFNAGARRACLGLLVLSHIVASGISWWLYLAYPLASTITDPNIINMHAFLKTSAMLDGSLLVVLVLLFLLWRPTEEEKLPPLVEQHTLSSGLLRWFYLIIGVVSVSLAAFTVWIRLTGPSGCNLSDIYAWPDPLIVNTVTKYTTLGAIGILMFLRPELRRLLSFIPQWVFGVTLMGTLVYAVQGSITIDGRGVPVSVSWIMPVELILNAGALMALGMLRRFHYRTDYKVNSLTPSSTDCAAALHLALREPDQHPEETVQVALERIDEEISGIQGKRRGIIAAPFFLIQYLFTLISGIRPPFSVMSPVEGRWMMRRFMLRPIYERERAFMPFLADLEFILGDTMFGLMSMVYFSSTEGELQVGYVIPSARKRLQGDIPQVRAMETPDASLSLPDPVDRTDKNGFKPASDPAKLAEQRAPAPVIPQHLSELPESADYVVIGSGAAGGVAAYRLARKYPGKRIVVIEQGNFVSPVQDFNEDEMRMLRLLYVDGALQTNKLGDFVVLQGQCLGGTTVVNNAVCFEMPDPAKGEWRQFGINVDELRPHYDATALELHITDIPTESKNKMVWDKLTQGVNGYINKYSQRDDLIKIDPVSTVKTNMVNCVGCGLCNIGCRRERKLSVLETYLPWARALGVEIFSGVSALKCESQQMGARKTVTGVWVRMPNGDVRQIRVDSAVVLAAGAVASSRLLMHSDLGADSHGVSWVGQHVSGNLGVPSIMQFPGTVDMNAYDGLQIEAAVLSNAWEAAFETDFLQPGSYSGALQQYFSKHGALMGAYPHTMLLGALVGSEPNGVIMKKRDPITGSAFSWQLADQDIHRMKNAMITQTLIAREAGAMAIHFPTRPVLSVPLQVPDDEVFGTLADFDRIVNAPIYFRGFTAHPQGGNLMGDNSITERVVDLDYRVRDTENLYVLDASIFPRSIRVNPQWTIMALASRAAESYI